MLHLSSTVETVGYYHSIPTVIVKPFESRCMGS